MVNIISISVIMVKHTLIHGYTNIQLKLKSIHLIQFFSSIGSITIFFFQQTDRIDLVNVLELG